MNERSRTPSEDSVPACEVITSFRTERAMAGRRSSASPFDEVFGGEPLAEKKIVRAMTRHGKFRGVAAKPKAAASQGMLRSIAVPGFWINVAWLWPRGRFITVREALAESEAQPRS